MLGVLHKYQKGLFWVVGGITILSFATFGTRGELGRSSGKSEVVILGKTLSGNQINSQEFSTLRLLIEETLQKGSLFYDEFFVRSIFRYGIAEAIFDEFSDEIKLSIEEKIAQHRRFVPYAHPQFSFLSVRNVWSQMFPPMEQAYVAFMQSTEAPLKEQFLLLSKLYILQEMVPSSFVKKALSYQMNRFDWITPDHQFLSSSLHIFNADHLDDWFGKPMADLITWSILNIAANAQLDEHVTTALAKERLKTLFIHNQQGSKEVQPFEIALRPILARGVSEQQLLKAYSVLEQCKKHVDALSAQHLPALRFEREFAQIAHEKGEFTIKFLPEELRIRSFDELFTIEKYCTLIGQSSGIEEASLPENILNLETIEKVAPELVFKGYSLSVKRSNLSEVAATIPVAEVSRWIETEEGFAYVQENFSHLLDEKGNREQSLASIEKEAKLSIIRSAREYLAISRGLLDRAIMDAPVEDILVSSNSLPDGIDDYALFEDAIESAESLYSQDGRFYYKILQSNPLEKRMLTLKEAVSCPQFQFRVEEDLKKGYQSLVKKKDPLIIKDGQVVAFEASKEVVAQHLLSGAITQLSSRFPSVEKSALPSYRFAHLLVDNPMTMHPIGIEEIVEMKKEVQRIQKDPLITKDTFEGKEEIEYSPRFGVFIAHLDSLKPAAKEDLERAFIESVDLTSQGEIKENFRRDIQKMKQEKAYALRF